MTPAGGDDGDRRPSPGRIGRARDTASGIRLRFTDEWVGLLVLGALALFGAAVIEAGVLQRWLNPGVRLVLLLPQTGTDGLGLGADVEVLGIHAGTVRRVRLNPDGEMYAVADIDADAKPFVRRDSKATIRRRFAVAGATYVDISRGKGAALDWSYAVLPAATEPDPIKTITTTVDQIRAELLPTLASAHATASGLQALVDGLRKGQGTVGKLLVDDTLVLKAEQSLATLEDALRSLRPIENRAGTVLAHADGAVSNLRAASVNVRDASKNLPAISRNAAAGTADLPALVTETTITADHLRKLIDQLRGSWLLGGGGTARRRPPGTLGPGDVSP